MKGTGWTALIVLSVMVVLIAFLWLGGREIGRLQIIDGLRADGYDVLIDKSVEPGEGRYCVRVWERGISWVEVER